MQTGYPRVIGIQNISSLLRNTILKLMREDGVEVTGEEGLKALDTNYFSSLFTPMASVDAADVLNHITPKVTIQMNDFLMTECTAKELKEALDNIGDLKALGVDGLPAIFTSSIGS